MSVEVHFGATRTVVLVRRWAIKFPGRWTTHNSGPFNRWFWRSRWKMLLHGMLGNMQEVDFSETKWAGLCPVLFALPGGLLVVMRRCRPLTVEEFDALDFVDLVTPGGWYARQNLEEWGGQAHRSNEADAGVIPAERKPSSFGWLDDASGSRIVAVDYG